MFHKYKFHKYKGMQLEFAVSIQVQSELRGEMNEIIGTI